MATEKQITANRENAQLSTGPVTPEGKASSSHNAVKTGLTGQTVLLKTDDVEAYNRHIQRFNDKFKPATDEQRSLVQDLADTEWRLLRIMPLEAGVLALGRLELAPLFAAETDASVRDAMLEAKVFLVYRKDLNNLSLQQTRLRKHRLNVIAELNDLQELHSRQVRAQAERAADYYRNAVLEDWHMNLTDFGFEFTLDEMIDVLATQKALQGPDAFPEVTKKVYRQEFRAEYEEHFGEE